MVHDHMRSYEVGSHDIKINKELCQSVGKSRQNYQEYLEEQRKQKSNRKRFKKKNCRRRNQGYLKEKKIFDCNY